jgi:hypothetical protein
MDEVEALRARAISLLAQNRVDDALNVLLQAAGQTHVAESTYLSILKPLVDACSKRGDARAAVTVLWYIGSKEPDAMQRAAQASTALPAHDRARTLAAMGDLKRAAEEMERAGNGAQSAILREKFGDYAGARVLWSRLAGSGMNGKDAYVGALLYFNLARCAKQVGDAKQARDASVAAVRLLEEAADHFESMGYRERAFDCFQVLVEIGRQTGFFEDVLEGFVNCIRILREDNLKYFALQHLEDAIAAARDRKELSAAATLAREGAEYARLLGMNASCNFYTQLQAELWLGVARHHEERGAPAASVENALLAAVLAFGEIGQFSKIGAIYNQLAQLELENLRRKHYARAAGRYTALRDEAIEAAPLAAHLRQDSGAADVWHADVVEWEQRGSAAEACADILLDARMPDIIRRKALLARLTAFAVEGRPEAAHTAATNARLAQQLSQLQMYAVLAPLEHLFESPRAEVRIAVLAAMQTLFFKRTFATIRAALKEQDAAVIAQAAKSLEALYFQHAFDPLSRIARESQHPSVKASALKALARVDTAESAEYMLAAIEHGAPRDRAAAVEALRTARGSRFVELARASLPTLPRDAQAAVREVLAARGIAA